MLLEKKKLFMSHCCYQLTLDGTSAWNPYLFAQYNHFAEEAHIEPMNTTKENVYTGMEKKGLRKSPS